MGIKLAVYYDSDTDEIIVVKANCILESDKIIKDIGLNPMKLIYTSLKICASKTVDELRKFTYYLKDKQGNLVIDDFGNLVWIEEYRYVDKEEITIYNINTTEDFKNLLYKLDVVYTYNDRVFISFGNNKRKYLSIEDFNNLIKNND